MTPKQLEFMAKCDHRKTCERLVTLNASSYADPYYWCACAACPYYTNENAKLRELVQDYDAMFAIAAKKEAATSIILPLDAVINALRIRAGLLGIEVPDA